MKTEEYKSYDGIGLAKLISKGEVQPIEIMNCALKVAESVNPKINALCYLDADLGREKARKADLKGRFKALPMLLKDSGLAATDIPGSMGSRLFENMETPFNATVTERLVADGFLPFGRTTAPEFSMAPTTEAIINGGPTRNPWNLKYSSGGSSGGAGAAVAAGIIPIAHGSDGAGSIRIPAACCGIYGLKPSRGLVPAGPKRGEGWGGLASDGVLTRTVRDSAAALESIAGMEVGAPYAAPSAQVPYYKLLDRPFERPMRIAVWTSGFEDIPIEEENLKAIQKTSTILTSMGHEVVDSQLPKINFNKFLKSQIDVLAANVTVLVNGKVRKSENDDWRGKIEPAILDAYELGKKITAEEYALAITRFHTVGRQMASYMEEYDFILTPTLMHSPARLGSISTNDSFIKFRTKVSRYTTFLAIINAAGLPAASLPMHWSDEGLPIGVQLVGHFGAESEVLRMSARLEEASPWFNKRPNI